MVQRNLLADIEMAADWPPPFAKLQSCYASPAQFSGNGRMRRPGISVSNLVYPAAAISIFFSRRATRQTIVRCVDRFIG